MNLAQFVIKAARFHPERPALARGARTVASYAEMAGRVARLAGGFRDGLGLGPGERVALAMSNDPEFMVVLFACWHAGLVAVPINAKLHRREFAYIIENSGTRVCIVTPKLEETVGGLEDEVASLDRVISIAHADYAALAEFGKILCADIHPDDPAWIFYTSGTTGQPKGATLSHRNLVAMTMNYFADVDHIVPGDCIIHAAPMSHGSGCYGLPHVAMAAKQVVPESGGFDPAEIVDLLRTHAGASFFMAPTMIVRLLASPALEGADTANLKTIIYGGGPMYAEDSLKALDRLGPKLVQIYGQGEAPMTITGLARARHEERDHPRFLERLASVGVERTDVEVRVVDADGKPRPPGEIGEIVLRGDVVMLGYWQNPQATADAIRNGWLHTGDMGAFDEDGFLTLKDRSRDMIISGGTNIYPREIEEVLLRHDSVLEASVVGKKHADWGEEVIAFIVPKEGRKATDGELDALCLDNIARFKRPKGYRHVDSLPKNNYGKVLKTVLRDRLERE